MWPWSPRAGLDPACSPSTGLMDWALQCSSQPWRPQIAGTYLYSNVSLFFSLGPSKIRCVLCEKIWYTLQTFVLKTELLISSRTSVCGAYSYGMWGFVFANHWERWGDDTIPILLGENKTQRCLRSKLSPNFGCLSFLGFPPTPLDFLWEFWVLYKMWSVQKAHLL